MDYTWSFIYGLIQGITEFLPVSSSGHLALIPFFTELKDPGVFFDLMMHLGTALAVIIYFRRKCLRLIKEAWDILLLRKEKNTFFTQNFICATICSFVLILFIKDLAFAYGRDPLIIGGNFIFFGLLMYLADRGAEKEINLTEKKNYKLAAIIGLSQSLAVFPGVSRSGATLTSARFLGMGRVEASEFSFLLSLPVILGSIVFKTPDLMKGNIIAVEASILISGVIFSFIFGILTIHFFLKIIAKVGLVYFSIYRVLVGALLIYLCLQIN